MRKVCLSALKFKVQRNPIPILILIVAFAATYLQSRNRPAHVVPKCVLSYCTSKMKKKNRKIVIIRLRFAKMCPTPNLTIHEDPARITCCIGPVHTFAKS